MMSESQMMYQDREGTTRHCSMESPAFESSALPPIIPQHAVDGVTYGSGNFFVDFNPTGPPLSIPKRNTGDAMVETAMALSAGHALLALSAGIGVDLEEVSKIGGSFAGHGGEIDPSKNDWIRLNPDDQGTISNPSSRSIDWESFEKETLPGLCRSRDDATSNTKKKTKKKKIVKLDIGDCKTKELRPEGSEKAATTSNPSPDSEISYSSDGSSATQPTAASSSLSSSSSSYAAWSTRLAQLREFKAKHGHANVPKQYPENQPLSNWVRNQRSFLAAKKSGKPSTMTDDREKALKEAGFEWGKRRRAMPGERAHAPWEERLEQLRLYKEANGDTKVPNVYTPNQALSNWVRNQRSFYSQKQKGQPTSLSDDRINCLNELGFHWP